MSKKKKTRSESNVRDQSAAATALPVELVADDIGAVKPPPLGTVTPERDYVWLGCSAFITVIAAFLRFFMLDLKPFHHDEGVNGFFLKTLFKDGIYKYDPANYHGPTLYYISVAFAKVFGLNTISVRASMAIFGVLMVVLVLYLRRYIGRVGALTAALFVALSPGMVFISRYFIHEIFFVFLSIAVFLSVMLFIEKRKAGPGAIAWMSVLLFTGLAPFALTFSKFIGGTNEGALFAFRIAFFLGAAAGAYYFVRRLLQWDEGRPIYLLLASASVALFFATKETAFITLGTMAIACVSVWIWKWIRENRTFENNLSGIMLAVHAAVVLAILYKSDTVGDAGKWLSDTFLPQSKPAETFVFYSIIFLLIGAIVAWIMFLGDIKKANQSHLAEPVELTWQNFRRGLGENREFILIIAAMATTFIYVSVVFFTSFFTYPEGIKKAFEAYAIWTKTGNKDHTQSGMVGYLKWGMKVEAPIMILSVLGGLVALLRGKHRFAMFISFCALGIFMAYSIIPYKTPWLALSFLLPMCIAAGYGIGELFESKNRNLKAAAAALAVVGSALLAYQTYQHNFVRYDDEDMTYVYAHTRRGFLDMIREIERYADKSGKGKDAVIEIVSPDYWPMTWYMNDYKANFHGSLVDASTSEMVVAKKNDQDTAMIQRYSPHYKMAGVYPLRPGVNLVLLVRNDLADPKDVDVNKVLEYKPIPGYTQ